jgi:iron complex transport system ATP-binding protein
MLKDGHIFKEGTPQVVITPDNIEQVFGVMAMVYGDLSSGLLVVNTSLARPRSIDGQKHIHVIGGGGSTVEIMQRLFIEGYRLTIGVLNQGDTDLSTALALGAEAVVVLPFAKIDDASHQRNIELAAQADCCLVADVPFGQGNLLNLKAAAMARRLVLIDNRPIEERDYTGGAAAALYSQLKTRAFCTDTANLKEALKDILIPKQAINAK